MLFPLGLGIRFPQFPWTTLVISTLLIVVFMFDSHVGHLERDVQSIYTKHQFLEHRAKLFVEYCETQKGVREMCQLAVDRAQEKSKTKTKNKTKEKNDTLSQMSHVLDEAVFYAYIYEQFLKKEDAHQLYFKNLSYYPTWLKSYQAATADLHTLFSKNSYLTKENITVSSLAYSQFRHGGGLHLFMNLLVFLFFGTYVEARLRRWQYIGAYLAGGTISMYLYATFFIDSHTPLLGASANVATIMGIFFVLFFHYRMRFLLWYFVVAKTFSVPVSVGFTVLYILLESALALEPNGVAHMAHVMGTALGIMAALAWKKSTALPAPFIYPFEEQYYRKLCQPTVPLDDKLKIAELILQYNNENDLAKSAMIQEIIRQENPESMDKKYFDFIQCHLKDLMAIKMKRDQRAQLYEVITRIPIQISLVCVLKKAGQKNILNLGDYAFEKKDYCVAFRLYDVYLTTYPSATQAPLVRQTMEDIFSTLCSSPEHDEFVKTYNQFNPASTFHVSQEEFKWAS